MQTIRNAVATTALLALMIVAFITAGPGMADDEKVGAKPVPVKVAVAQPSPDAGRIIVSGTITYKREQVLSFKTGGVVHRYAVDAGDTVKQGDPLVSADPSDTAGRRAEAEAAFAAAKANLDRVTKLHASGAESAARLDDARTSFQRASAALSSARFDESRAALVAASDGVVLVRHAEVGQQMAPGAPVITLGDTTSGMIMRAPLSDTQVVRVRTGDRASLSIAGATLALEGAVTRIGAKANPLTGAFDVEITLASIPDGLRSGLVAEATLTPSIGDESQALVAVPAIALIEGQGDAAYVFVISADLKASRAAVTIAGFAGDSVLIRSGLKAGDRVATSGAAYLRNGQPVTIEPAVRAPAASGKASNGKESPAPPAKPK
jgi:multidrug efflux system membrane fusion protein